MKKTILFAILLFVNYSMQAAEEPYLPGTQVKSDLSDVAQVISDATTLTLPEGDFTLEMSGKSGQAILLVKDNMGYEFTPTSDGRIRFISVSGVLYVYENAIYMGTVEKTVLKSSFPEVNDSNADTVGGPLLVNCSFETVGDFAQSSTTRYCIGEPWITNVTWTHSGFRINHEPTRCKNGEYDLCWRGKGNAYISQPVSVKPATQYRIVVSQLDGSTETISYKVGLGSAAGQVDLCNGQVSLCLNRNGQQIADVTTPAQLPETVFFTFASNGTNSGLDAGSGSVTLIDYISLVEAVGEAADGLTGNSDGWVLFIDGTAYLPKEADKKNGVDMTSYALQNYGFESDNYVLLMSNKNTGFKQPEGWTLTEYSKSADGYDHSTLSTTAYSGNKSFQLRLRWGAARSMAFEQTTAELPKGIYRLSAYVMITNSADANNVALTLTDSNGATLATATAEAQLNKWVRFMAEFSLSKPQTLKIGAKAKASNPQNAESIFRFDEFHLAQYDAVSFLQNLIDQANGMLAEGTPLFNKVLKEQMLQEVAAANDAIANDDEQAMEDVAIALAETIKNVQESVKNYAALADYVKMIELAVNDYERTDLADYLAYLQQYYAEGNFTDNEAKAEIAKQDEKIYNVPIEPVNHDLYKIVQRFNIDEVETTFPVQFCHAFAGDNHYIGYYDKDKNMCVGYRKLNEQQFQKTLMNSKIGWDSHNYVTMIVDREGYIHVSGNMHNVQLKYWRSVRPYDASEFTFYNTMVGTEESSVTYPKFLMTQDGQLLFHYRVGSSGNGYEVYNVWDAASQTWSRFLDKPMIDGEGQRNAYMQGPVYQNGYYHLYWVWRQTADCSTNHDFSYARSKDLKTWESAQGQVVASPMVYSETALKVDAPELKKGNGMLNGVQRMVFDSQGNLILCNMKYDENGYTQFYAYKLDENGKWRESRLTNWLYRFQFSGVGSINYTVNMGSIRNVGDGTIGLGFNSVKYGKGEIVFDENTLERIKYCERTPLYPEELDEVTTLTGTYSSKISAEIHRNGNFIMRRETMSTNNDQKPADPISPNMQLELIEFVPKDDTVTSVRNVTNPLPAASDAVYDLQGRRYHSEFKNPNYRKGIYIVSSQGKNQLKVVK